MKTTSTGNSVPRRWFCLKTHLAIALAGAAAGAVAGLFGAGGGMVLIPLLGLLTPLAQRELFPSCLTIIIPICLITLTITAMTTGLPWKNALPYLPGSAIGGYLAGKWGHKIPVIWLHRGLGILILWGGIRFLC